MGGDFRGVRVYSTTNITIFDLLLASAQEFLRYEMIFVFGDWRVSLKKIFLLLLTVYNSQASTYDRSSLRVNHRVCCERAEPALRTDNGISFVLARKNLHMIWWKGGNMREFSTVENSSPFKAMLHCMVITERNEQHFKIHSREISNLVPLKYH